jgi:signal transduction histidine kinase
MPLTVLIPILEKQETDDKKLEILQVLYRNVQYMRNIAIKTLELAKLNSPKTKFLIEKLDLKSEIKKILQSKKTIFEPKNLVVTNKVTNKIFVKADKLRLEELFINLLENSVKFSEFNGKIIINAEEEKDYAKISIKDTGLGMTEEQIKYVFEEFYKADQSRHDFHSSGLGLTISKRIVEKHNGKIWMESKGPDKGSTVYFTLPLYKNKEERK